MSEMKRVYDAFKERQAQRRKFFGIYVISIIIYILLGILIVEYVEWFTAYWTVVGFLGIPFGFFYGVTRPWSSETIESNIFVNFYQAYKSLELCSKGDENSCLYSKKAHSKSKNATLKLKRLSSRLNNSRSKLLKNQIGKPFKTLVENLNTRILPRIIQQEDITQIRSVLKGLAKIFGEAQHPINLAEIISKNTDLERFEPIEIEDALTKFKAILAMGPIKFCISIFLAFMLITFILSIHSLWYKSDLSALFSNPITFIEIIGIGLGLGYAIYTIIRQKV